jgi:hypothetical protein
VNPSDRLQAARLAAREGRHAEALREHEWFHRDALKHQPSLYGVRLSFALWDWVQLGKVYPQARRSLDRIRRDKMAALRKGKGNWETFHDVVAINEYTGKQRDTHRLFLALVSSRRKLADKCARIAMPAVVKCRDFKLARRYLPDLNEELTWRAKLLNDDIERARQHPRKRRIVEQRADIENYCKDVRLLTAILRGTGERKSANECRRTAINLITSRSVRRAVASRLTR